MSDFEKKFGKYAIKNLPLILVCCYAIGYILQLVWPMGLSYLYLNPYSIIHKFQIWRLVTWILVPPGSFDIFTLIVLYFYYSIGSSLSYVWGNYKFNLYIFSGILFTIVGAFLFYGYTYLTGSAALWEISVSGVPVYASMFSTYYINMSIFLAYAATFPDAQILLFMIIPIRVKYLGIIYGAMLVYELIGYAVKGGQFLALCIVIIISLLNFFIFFITQKKKLSYRSPMMFSRQNYKQKMSQTDKDMGFDKRSSRSQTMQSRPSSITRHKCAICGKTEATNPNMSFRFCSKCNGNYEYCEEHLFTHTHVI